jgi:galactose mutarotase-like enzyme
MLQISNGLLTAGFSEKGAELKSLVNHQTGLEYIWCGDPAFWGKTSPVLFPIVGGLRNNQYQFNDRSWHMGRHGFARDKVFRIITHGEDHITFSCTHDEASLSQYPFHFELQIMYRLRADELIVTYQVQNLIDGPMYFSIGAHPAFAVPLVNGTQFDEYHLYFNQIETAGIWPLSAEGLILDEPVPYLQEQQQIPLHKPLFYGDALVFKGLQSTALSIVHPHHEHGLTVSFSGFPYLGIWSAKDANFVCIEPWQGIADHVSSTGKLEEKEGIIQLAPNAIHTCSWQVHVY